ncbi:preprotein translocase subunit YajC [Bounagaea algeriensis]
MEFLPIVLILAIGLMLFFQVRKQKKMMADQQKLQNSLTVGDRVMTTSGVYGTITATAEDTVDLELAPGVTTTWLRQAIRQKANDEQTDAADSSTQDSAAQGSAEAEPATTASDSNAQFAEPIENQKN